jgi:nitrite reductase/ring-hydroxylating ferredoxin subunit
MSDAWKSYSGAPSEGTFICPLQDVPDDNTLCLEINGFPVLLLRRGDDIRAFVNACPHQYLPLNHKGVRLMSADKTILRCTNHSAGFRADTGEGVEGFGIGECLDAIPVTLDNGMISVA